MSTLRRTAMLVIALLLMTSLNAIRADVVILNNGEQIEGEITKEDKYKVRIKDAKKKTHTFKRDEVKEIKHGPTSWDEFDERLDALEGDDVDGRVALLQFAQEKGLEKRGDKLAKEIFKIDPDHAEARAAAGYVEDEGKWITLKQKKEKERRAMMAKMPSFSPGRTNHTWGSEKSILVIPNGYSKDKMWPTCIVLHGNGDTASYFLQWFIGSPPAGYVLIVMENNQGMSPISSVVKELDTTIAYDPERLYAIGFSGGSYPVAQAPFTHKETFAAVAFGGGGLGGGNIPEAGKNAHGNYVWCGEQDLGAYKTAETSVTNLKEKGYDVIWDHFPGGHTDKSSGMLKKIWDYFGRNKLDLD